MKLFDCQVCDQILYFENNVCESCSHRLGYVAEDERLYAIDREDPQSLTWHVAEQPGRKYRFCHNAAYGVCNWLVAAEDDAQFCRACRHNHIVPDLSLADNTEFWRLMEVAKHRLFYTLLQLRLPLFTRTEDPKEGLIFDFLQDPVGGKKVMTGHEDGKITISLAEADDAEREKRRKSMHEPYRTLLGHFRHEIAHYYWDRLVRGQAALEPFRVMFGDERDGYAAALQRHYQNGAPPNWRENFVSAYATCHPWEDFAETFAHYLHIVDTLETADSFGMSIHPRGVAHASALDTEVDFAPAGAGSFQPLIKAWLPITFALNSLNRSMGMGDLYPFILSQAVVRKLGFIHALVHGTIGQAEEEPASEEALAAVPS